MKNEYIYGRLKISYSHFIVDGRGRLTLSWWLSWWPIESYQPTSEITKCIRANARKRETENSKISDDLLICDIAKNRNGQGAISKHTPPPVWRATGPWPYDPHPTSSLKSYRPGPYDPHPTSCLKSYRPGSYDPHNSYRPGPYDPHPTSSLKSYRPGPYDPHPSLQVNGS